MQITQEPLTDKKQTIEKVRYMIKKYANDLYLKNISLGRFFDLIKKIKYRRDKKGIETVARPKLAFKLGKIKGIDCKKKAVLMGAYAIQHKIPCRIVVSSNRPDKQIHHIFLQFKINGKWKNADSTYNFLQFGEPKILTNYEIHEV